MEERCEYKIYARRYCNSQCLDDCTGLKISTKVDRVQINPYLECMDENTKFLAFSRVNSAVDHAAWAYSRYVFI